MKVARFVSDQRARVGVVSVDGLFDAGTDPLNPKPTGRPTSVSSVQWLPPVIPSKIVAVGLNYRDHIRESGLAEPGTPLLFAKWPSSMIGHGGVICLPAISESVDYEAELAVVIGRRARSIRVGDALDYVYGYTCLNDVTARDLQFLDGQWMRAKSLDTFCPIGPWIVTADEIPDPQALSIRTLLDGAVVQDSSTSLMVFGVAELIAFVSEAITLEPGDVIATGTPSGVGMAQRPPRFLANGSTVTVQIGGIGSLTNSVSGRQIHEVT